MPGLVALQRVESSRSGIKLASPRCLLLLIHRVASARALLLCSVWSLPDQDQTSISMLASRFLSTALLGKPWRYCQHCWIFFGSSMVAVYSESRMFGTGGFMLYFKNEILPSWKLWSAWFPHVTDECHSRLVPDELVCFLETLTYQSL